MKIKQFMERVGIRETGRALAYIQDGIEEINMISEVHVATTRMDIIEDKRFYDYPSNMIKVLDIRAKNHLNQRDEYRSVLRLVGEPLTKDEDGL